MKKINVTCICAASEEYPGCADLLYSYSEFNVVACPTCLAGAATHEALANSDVLVVDESVLARDGFRLVKSTHTAFPGLNILLVYEKNNEINMLEYLSIGFRGLIERKSCVSLLRKAIPAMYAGEVWMPRELVQLIRYHSSVINNRKPWEVYPSMMPERERMN